MTISYEPSVEIDPSLSQNVSCMNPLYFFAVWDSQMAAVTKIIMDFDQICVRMILA